MRFFVYYVVNFTTLLIVGCVADLVPIFEIAFVQGVSLRAVTKLCKGMGHDNEVRHFSTFTVFDHGHQCGCRECASSPRRLRQPDSALRALLLACRHARFRASSATV